MILGDIEFAELMMLQGATHTLEIDPRRIWMVESSTSEHQPECVTTNRNFTDTFEMFSERSYHAFAVDKTMQEIAGKSVADIAAGRQALVTISLLCQ